MDVLHPWPGTLQLLQPLTHTLRGGWNSLIACFSSAREIAQLSGLNPPFFLGETEDREANVTAHKSVDHLASLYQVDRRFHSRESNCQPLL